MSHPGHGPPTIETRGLCVGCLHNQRWRTDLSSSVITVVNVNIDIDLNINIVINITRSFSQF